MWSERSGADNPLRSNRRSTLPNIQISWRCLFPFFSFLNSFFGGLSNYILFIKKIKLKTWLSVVIVSAPEWFRRNNETIITRLFFGGARQRYWAVPLDRLIVSSQKSGTTHRQTHAHGTSEKQSGRTKWKTTDLSWFRSLWWPANGKGFSSLSISLPWNNELSMRSTGPPNVCHLVAAEWTKTPRQLHGSTARCRWRSRSSLYYRTSGGVAGDICD